MTIDFDTPVNEISTVWEIGDKIDRRLHDEIAKFVNKHVYLSLQTAAEEIDPLATASDEGDPEVTIYFNDISANFTDVLWPSIKLEPLFMKMRVEHYDAEIFIKMAASFMRIAEHLENCAAQSENRAISVKPDGKENDK